MNRHTILLISTSSVVHPPSFRPFLKAGFSVCLNFISVLPFFTHLHTFHSQIQLPQLVSPPSPLRCICNTSHSQSSINKALCITHNDSHLWISPPPPPQQVRLFLCSYLHYLSSDTISLVMGSLYSLTHPNSLRPLHYFLQLVSPSVMVAPYRSHLIFFHLILSVHLSYLISALILPYLWLWLSQ